MIDDEKNENEVEETPAEEALAEDSATDEPTEPEAAPAEEAPAETAEEPVADAPAEEPAAEEPAAEEPADEEPPAEEALAEDAATDEPTEPEEALSPKQRRKRERSAHTGEAAAQRSPEERQADRDAVRAKKAARRSAHRTRTRAKQAERRGAATPLEDVPALHPDVPKGNRKERQGVVVSDKADKTITVRIDVTRRHRFYEKVIRSSTTLHAHDERNEANTGDTVRVIESRPLSRTKRWRLVEVLERAR